METTILRLQDEILASFDYQVYLEWSKELLVDLEMTAWLIDIEPYEMYWC